MATASCTALFTPFPPLSNADGVYTNAVFGFLSMLFKVVGDEQPRYLAVAFDLHGPTFRHKDYSEYKAAASRPRRSCVRSSTLCANVWKKWA